MLVLYASQANFQAQFADQAKQLQANLGDSCTIEHVGSTAVPGVEGKGIIDILIGFETAEQLKRAVIVLSHHGYYGGTTQKRNNYLFMASTENESTLGDTHIHLTLKASKTFKDFLTFRDYLRLHPDTAKAYSELKHRIAQECNFDREAYRKKKGSFIKNLIRMAS